MTAQSSSSPDRRLPHLSTTVTFPDGGLAASTVVQHVEPLDYCHGEPRVGVFTDRTPVHPLDPWWPDQPADRATLTVGEAVLTLQDAMLAAIDPDGSQVFLDRAPARRGAPGWSFVVCHVVAARPDQVRVGQPVQIQVDADYRHQLSRSHTACHLTALALNRVTAAYWSKAVRRDSLGAPNLDQLAVQRSRISTNGSVDEYRFGRTLRKAGLRTAELLSDLPKLQAATQHELDRFIASDADVHIRSHGHGAGDVREWVCKLPDTRRTCGVGAHHSLQGTVTRTAQIPCGGTHVRRLSEVGSPKVALLPAEDDLGMQALIRFDGAEPGQ